jgi:hypothetical protein
MYLAEPPRYIFEVHSDENQSSDPHLANEFTNTPERTATIDETPAFLEVMTEQFSNGDQIEPEAMKSILLAMLKMMESK